MSTLFNTLPSDRVRRLEQAGVNSWPALSTVLDGPWVIRLADGVTKRANSINTLGEENDSPADLRQRLDRACSTFRRQGLPPVFRATPLTGTATLAELGRRGWTERDPSLLMLGPLTTPETSAEPDLLSDHPTAEWLATFARIDGLPPQDRCTLKSMVRRLALPRAYACAAHDGQPASVAMAVIDGPLMGLFCVGTIPEARRQGLSQRVLSALRNWGLEQGASQLWLHVSATNTGAQTLYRGLGMTPAYGYTYFVAPAA